jgi:hypothetical protein
VNHNGSNQEGSEEAGEEDRKKEIVFRLHAHTHFLGWRRNPSSLLFLRSP